MPRCRTCPARIRRSFRGVSHDRCCKCRWREYMRDWQRARRVRDGVQPRQKQADDLSPEEIERVFQAALRDVRARRRAA